MAGFDIENLLEFKPADIWCLKCFALWEDFVNFDTLEREEKEYAIIDVDNDFAKCKICGVNYTRHEVCRRYDLKHFIDYEVACHSLNHWPVSCISSC